LGVQSLINKKLVFAQLLRQIARETHINIFEPVGIDIDDDCPCRPGLLPSSGASGKGNISELQVSLIEKKFVLTLIGCEIQIFQAIIIEVTDRDSSTVVEVLIG